jgi:hypothetical protein
MKCIYNKETGNPCTTNKIIISKILNNNIPLCRHHYKIEMKKYIKQKKMLVDEDPINV